MAAIYTTTKLDVRTQLNLARRLSPAVPILDLVLEAKAENKNQCLLTALMLSKLDDADNDYVVNKCLAVVSRQQDDGTHAKLTNQSGLLMFDDLTLTELLDLTARVIEENLGDFFYTALSSLNQPKQ
jgi:hypothetical protein